MEGATINNIVMAYNISDFYEKLSSLETMHQERLKHVKDEY